MILFLVARIESNLAFIKTIYRWIRVLIYFIMFNDTDISKVLTQQD